MSRFGGQPFTPHDDALILRMAADGWPFSRIAEVLGRATRQAVRGRYMKLQTQMHAAADAVMRSARVKHRDCGRCGARFLSPHAGVRRCDPCRDTFASPFEPDDLPGSVL